MNVESRTHKATINPANKKDKQCATTKKKISISHLLKHTKRKIHQTPTCFLICRLRPLHLWPANHVATEFTLQTMFKHRRNGGETASMYDWLLWLLYSTVITPFVPLSLPL